MSSSHQKPADIMELYTSIFYSFASNNLASCRRRRANIRCLDFKTFSAGQTFDWGEAMYESLKVDISEASDAKTDILIVLWKNLSQISCCGACSPSQNVVSVSASCAFQCLAQVTPIGAVPTSFKRCGDDARLEKGTQSRRIFHYKHRDHIRHTHGQLRC